MNYAASKNAIVPVSNDTPAQLSNFITILQQRTKYNVPFFLAPVRLETRFRKVMRNIMDEVIRSNVSDASTRFTGTKDISVAYGTYGGFKGSTVLAAATELNDHFNNLVNTLDNVQLVNPVEQDELRRQSNDLSATLGRTFQNFQSVSMDDEESSQLQEIMASIQSSSDNITGSLSKLQPDNSWAQEVSQATIDQWARAGNIVQSSNDILRNMDQYNVDQNILNQYFRQASAVLDYFKEPINSIDDKQYVWNILSPFDDQFIYIQQLLAAAQAQGRDMTQSKNDLSLLTTKLSDAWNRNAFPDLASDYLQPVPGTEDFRPGNKDVSGSVAQQGDTINKTVISGNDLIGKLLTQPDQLQEDVLDQYNAQLKNMSAFLDNSGTVKELVGQGYLWQIIAPLNAQLRQVKAYINGFIAEGIGAAFQQLDSLNGSIATLTNSWNTLTLTDTNPRTVAVFSTWRLVDELWIRVYPDNISVDSLERELTTDERDAGIAYWTAWWAAHGDPQLQLAAWQALVTLYGPERAAWIVKVMTPTNLQNVIIVSSIFDTFAHLEVLNTYTAQLSTLNPLQLSPSAGSYLAFYNPQLQYLTGAADKVQALPGVYLDRLSDKVRTAGTSFAQFGDFVLSQVEDTSTVPMEGGGEPVSDGGGEQPKNITLQERVTGINASFDTLRNVVSRIQRVETWDQIYSQTPVFPTPALKDASWSQASYARTLPDSFLFATVNNLADGSYSFRHIKIGNQIPNPLQTSIDPEFSTFSDTAAGHMVIDPNLLWMVDFNEAVNKGMGIIIRLTAAEAQAGFDKLLVLGVNTQAADPNVSAATLPDIGKKMLQDLLDAHHYTPGGMAVLRLGTPTNNTDDTNAGYNRPDPYAELSFATEVQNALFGTSTDTLRKKDGQWLCDAFGIDYSALQHTENAGLSQISNAIAMNRVLWNGTAGNYMKEMMNFLFTDDNTQRTKSYFTDYVLGRGALPSIRTAEQPYGILPVSSFGRWEWPQKYPAGTAFPSGLKSGSSIRSFFLDDYTQGYPSGVGSQLPQFLEDRFHIRLSKVLETLNQFWLEMAAWHVNTVNKNTGNVSAQQDFMTLLSTEALMSEARNRFFLNALSFNNTYSLKTEGNAAADFWTQILADPANTDIPSGFFSLFGNFNSADFSPGTGAPNPLGDANGIMDINEFLSGGSGAPQMSRIKNALRIFTVRFMSEKYSLYGPSVDEKPLTEKDVLTANVYGKNYIKWLRTSNPYDIWQSNNFGHMPSRSLLYLLMRQSVLLTYREAAWDILEKANLFTRVARKIIGTPEGIVTQQSNTTKQGIFTKWHPLFENIKNLTASPSHYLTKTIPLDDAFKFFYNYVGDITAPYKPAYAAPTWQGIKLADYLFNPVPALGAGYNDLNALGSDALGKIAAMNGSLDLLQSCTVAELDRLMREHVDLCSYRLDAWSYGMINKRLWEHRNMDGANSAGARKAGIYLGAYGWLVDVKPNINGLVAINPTHVPGDLTEFGTLYYDQANLGFIHTPSVSHALTAAILRSGYVSENNSADNRFAINLSSERVRIALDLLEGVRNGQTLGALMGYQFERGLHEGYPGLELDKYIYVFRRKFPLVGGATDASTAIPHAENIRPSNVVDGIELLNHFRTAAAAYLNAFPGTSIHDMYVSPGTYQVSGHPLSYIAPYSIMDTADYTGFSSGSFFTQEMMAIITEIDRIANAIDALGDLTIAEGVFQMAKSNYGRSAAILETLTEGKNPTTPQIIDTPRTGTHINHRMAAVIEPLDFYSVTSPWVGITLSPRAYAEPNINKWMAQVLIAPFAGATVSTLPDKIGCTVTFNDAGNVLQSATVKLSQLDIQPIDLLYMVQSDGYKAELTARIVYYIRSTSTLYYGGPAGIPTATAITVNLANKGTATLASFQQILTLTGAAARIVNESKYLKPEDFLYSPNADVNTLVSQYDTTELAARVTDLMSRLNTVQTNLASIPVTMVGGVATIPDSVSNNTAVNNLRSYLKSAAAFGISYTIPASATEVFAAAPDTAVEGLVADLLVLKQKATAEISKRYTAAGTAYAAITGGMSESDKVTKYIAIITTILGAEFKVLPHFHFDHYNGLYTAITAQLPPVATTNDIMYAYLPESSVALKMDEWLYGIARVQEKVGEIETIRLLADDTNDYALRNIRPVQFPYLVTTGTGGPVGDYWLGTEYPSGYTPSGDKLSVAVLNYDKLPATATATTPFCGLLISEWSELIPIEQQTTGIAFNYDNPNAKPPQNILLAVNPQVVQVNDPNPNKTWHLEDLLHTMLDTMDMAKVRMVDPDSFARLDGSEINDNRKNDAANRYPTSAEMTRSKMYELFRWVLPAVTGEITPEAVTAAGTPLHPEPQYQNVESIQQVSFDYNPNNAGPPIVPGTVTSTGVTGVVNWKAISTDDILSNTGTIQFIEEEATFTAIANAQAGMTAISGV